MTGGIMVDTKLPPARLGLLTHLIFISVGGVHNELTAFIGEGNICDSTTNGVRTHLTLIGFNHEVSIETVPTTLFRNSKAKVKSNLGQEMPISMVKLKTKDGKQVRFLGVAYLECGETEMQITETPIWLV